MKRRIESLIRKNGFSNYKDYLYALKSNTKIYKEFINYLTINVSEFFRNLTQWKTLEQRILPYLMEHFGKKLKIWSAACSSGDEPYTLVLLLSQYMPLNQIKIIATDIDDKILNKAKVGLYSEKSIASIPKELLVKYFKQVGPSYQISDKIKSCVEFSKHNLLEDPYPVNCDLIVCRNVLIYFTEEAKVDIYRKFNHALKENGILFVGSTEQIIHASDFCLSSIQSFFYKKDASLKSY